MKRLEAAVTLDQPANVDRRLARGAHDRQTMRGMEDLSDEVYVEASQAGGWLVKLTGSAAPLSFHDSEEEALSKADAYRRGIERDRSGHSGQSTPSGP